MSKPRKGLGKGINALFTDELEINQMNEASKEVEKENKKVVETDNIDEVEKDDYSMKKIEDIKLIDIEPNPNQARKTFNEEKLNQLAESIEKFGILQPIILTKKDNYYEIVAGERRWRAAKIAGLKTIPSIVRKDNSNDNQKISLIENLQRENLNPVERARGYRQIIDDFDYNITEVARAVSKDRSSVSTSLDVLSLDEKVLDYVEKNGATEKQCLELLRIENLSAGVEDKEILKNEDPELQYEVAVFMLEDGISASEARRRLNAVTRRPKKKEDIFLPIFKEVEDEFSSCFGTKVKLKTTNKNASKGQIILKYNSNEDLERILNTIKEFN